MARDRRDLELVRRLTTPTTTASTRPARRRPCGARPSASARRSVHSTGNGAPGLRHVNAPAPFTGIARRRLHPVRRDRLGFDQERLPDHRQRRHPVVRPRARRDRRRRRRRRRRRGVLVRRRHPQHDPRRTVSPGRPGAARAARPRSSVGRRRARLPGRRRPTVRRSRTASRSRPAASSSRPPRPRLRRCTQGSGSVQALAAAVNWPAARRRAVVTPVRVAARRLPGRPTFAVFPHILPAGGTDSQTFTLDGPGT